jgi:large subunit ribosomal protein L22
MATIEQQPEVEFRAQARYVRTAPRKAQLVVSEIRYLRANDARVALRFMTRAAALDVAKVLDSAIANAESHPTSSYDPEDLYVSAAYVGEGPVLKRWRARARGRVGRIRKRTCHITVHLAPVPGATAVKPAESVEQPRRGRARPEAAAPAEAPAVAEEPAAEAAVETEPEAPAEAEAAPAPKPRRSRKAAADETAAPSETEAAEAEAVEEAPATPRRTRKAAADSAAGEPPAKPRRSRSTPKRDAAPGETEAEEKPTPRRTRKKSDESSPEGEA